MGNIDWQRLPDIWGPRLLEGEEALLYFPPAPGHRGAKWKLPPMFRVGLLDDWRGRDRKPTHWAKLTVPQS